MTKGDLLIVDVAGKPVLCEYRAKHLTSYGLRHDLRIVEGNVDWSSVDLDAFDWTLVA